ncbi:MAG: MFS transporter [Patescibacteria group bacterium]
MQLRPDPKSHVIYTIAVIGFIFTLHLAIPIYSNSSFLALFTDARTIGWIYMAGAAAGILGYLLAPWVIRKLGNHVTSIALICIQIALMYGFISATSIEALAILFALQTAVGSLISLTLDIFLEVYTDGHKVGTIRGLYITTLNASWVIAPLLGSMLIGAGDNYRNTYVAALAMLFPLLYLVYRNFPRFKDPHYKHFSPWQLMARISSSKNWVRLFSANIILQTFYAWMVVYSPIYLHQHVGFDWDEIGIILTIMLLPFVLIQYPLGQLADRRYGEKEIMAIGFTIMAVATAMLPLISSNRSVALWAFALFMTRVGAAAAEIMIETYFFKTVSIQDSGMLGFFRITRHASYFIAPLITVIGLMFTDSTYLFTIVGAVCLVALYPVLTIRDTN